MDDKQKKALEDLKAADEALQSRDWRGKSESDPEYQRLNRAANQAAEEAKAAGVPWWRR